ncbi:MAG TPA: D-aminoacyl-tRNA deacylase [Dehalococcoidia bacterium]|jgi:D-tyrosyl-tRNA(Tyr) deacylase|nr:D-aminoacyl-tRNA deacylase [Dehalococcoidia bacterium]
MRAVVQRVTRARVTIDGETSGEIAAGLLVYVGVAEGDSEDEACWLATKIAQLRIFDNDEGQFDRSLLDSGGAALVVSQFTLLADTRRGRRPSFTGAARPEVAEPLVEAVMKELRALGVTVAGGRFGSHMMVESENDGPVTIPLDSAGD